VGSDRQRKDERPASYSNLFDTPESFTARDWANGTPWATRINLNAPAGGFAEPYAAYPSNPVSFPYPPNKNAPFPQQGAYINFSESHPPLHTEVESEFCNASSARIGWLRHLLGDKGSITAPELKLTLPIRPGATLGNLKPAPLLYSVEPAQALSFGDHGRWTTVVTRLQRT